VTGSLGVHGSRTRQGTPPLLPGQCNQFLLHADARETDGVADSNPSTALGAARESVGVFCFRVDNLRASDVGFLRKLDVDAG
jgi:hypothetical protein